MLPDTYQPSRPPFEHQRRALEAGWDRPGFAYLLEMGLGKTRILIDNMCLLRRAGKIDALLVVAPKGVYTNWSRVGAENPGELQAWTWPDVWAEALVYTWRSGPSKKEKAEHAALLEPRPQLRILVVNVEALSATGAMDLCTSFCRAHRTLLVVDESTVMKNPTAARTKMLLRLGRLAPYRRILTGSPITGNPIDLFPQFELLEPAALGHRSFYTFRERYCVMREISIGGRTIKTQVGVRNMSELAARVDRHAYRARKADCLDLPDKIYERRDVELTPEQQRLYADLKRTAMAQLEDGTQVTTQLVVTQMMRLHQVVCGHIRTDDGATQRLPENRTQALLDLLEETDEPTVVWCGYQADLRNVAAVLRKRYGAEAVAEWYGGVSGADREAGEADFQAGRTRFMVASPQAGGRGRTWTAATLVVYYSNSYSLELRQQSEDRAHRIGQTRTVTYVDLVSPGTVDETIMRALRGKLDIVREVLRDGPAAWF